MATEEKRRRDLVSGEQVAFPKPSSESSSVVATSPAPIRKVIVKSADMKESMQKEAIDCAIAAFEKHGVEKDIAEQIKKEFDKNYGPTWHCIVGRNFDSDFRLMFLGPKAGGTVAGVIGPYLIPTSHTKICDFFRHMFVCHPRDQPLHLLLFRSEGYLAVQIRLTLMMDLTGASMCITVEKFYVQDLSHDTM